MKKNLVILILSFILASSPYADVTKKSKISQVLYNGNADYTFFVSESGWDVKDSGGNILCQPYYVQITNGVQGRDKILSVGLAAKMAGATVDFLGECNSDPTYFNAHYIRLY